MKKSFLIIIACITSIICFQAFTSAPQPRFKNLQILPKDISEDVIDSVMHHFSAALGVKCNYCHVRNTETKKMEFDKDDKPEKLIARKMMLMSMDINTKYFKEIEEEISKEKGHETPEIGMQVGGDSVKNMLSYVTCFTCHHGEPHPVAKPPKAKENSIPVTPPAIKN